MKHLVVGDVHGYHKNLRTFLREQKVIDKKGNRINRDTIKVYCTGDLIDGSINRQGDLLNLEFAPNWFDAVCLGNHEMAFIGSDKFGGKRRHDRKTTEMLLRLIDDEIMVPAILIPGGRYGDLLATHAGFSEYFGFDNPADAYEYIKVMWEIAPALDEEIAVFDWQGPVRALGYGDPTGGIFELDWDEDRNGKFNQISGHTIIATGPVHKLFNEGGIHWNIDVGGKHGKGIGALMVDDESSRVMPLFWGDRHNSYKSVGSQYTYGSNKKFEKQEGKFPGWHEVNEGVWAKDKEPVKYEEETVRVPLTTLYPAGTTRSGTVGQQLLLPVGFESEKPDLKVVLSEQDGKPVVKIAKTVDDGDYIRQSFKSVPLASLDDIDIQLIDDPEILEAYRKETEAGFKMKLQNTLH